MEKEKATIGIDPGVSGCMVLLKTNGDLYIHDFEYLRLSYQMLKDWHFFHNIEFAILEKINLRPKEKNVRSIETLLRNSAMWVTFLKLLLIDYEEYPPSTWRKGLVSGKPIKKKCIEKAQSLFPEHSEALKKADRAEAALMAYRAMKHIQAGRPTKL